jgi:hypothetical protein
MMMVWKLTNSPGQQKFTTSVKSYAAWNLPVLLHFPWADKRKDQNQTNISNKSKQSRSEDDSWFVVYSGDSRNFQRT